MLLGLIMLAVITYVGLFLFIRMAHGQEIGEPQRAYTIADPVRPDGMGIATLGGRYAISLGDGCSIGPDQNVDLATVSGFSGIGVIRQANEPWCMIRFEQQVADVPCFTDEYAQCDIAAEMD